MNKIHDMDPIVLDDIYPTLDWVVETQEPEFGPNFNIEVDVLGNVSLEVDRLFLILSLVHASVESRSIIFCISLNNI